MKPFPNKIPLASLPTKIEKLERFSEQTGISVYIKRDDLTGMEYSGNKIRKLEYAVREALGSGSRYAHHLWRPPVQPLPRYGSRGGKAGTKYLSGA